MGVWKYRDEIDGWDSLGESWDVWLRLNVGYFLKLKIKKKGKKKKKKGVRDLWVFFLVWTNGKKTINNQLSFSGLRERSKVKKVKSKKPWKSSKVRIVSKGLFGFKVRAY